MTRKAQPKWKPTIEAKDEERVSDNAATEEESDLEETVELEIDLNQEISISDEEKSVDCENDGNERRLSSDIFYSTLFYFIYFVRVANNKLLKLEKIFSFKLDKQKKLQ